MRSRVGSFSSDSSADGGADAVKAVDRATQTDADYCAGDGKAPPAADEKLQRRSRNLLKNLVHLDGVFSAAAGDPGLLQEIVEFLSEN